MTHKINSYRTACEKLGIDPKKSLPDVSHTPKKHQDAVIAYYALTIIISALNEGWEPDWRNPNERKYYPWFDMSSGFGLSYCGCACTGSDTDVGSRLVLKSSELAEYAGKQFQHIYKKAFVIE